MSNPQSLDTLPLRVGVIGTGRIASTIGDEIEMGPFNVELPYSHAGAYAAVPDTQMVAAADVESERLGQFATRWSVPATYLDYREMLDHEELDIVSICTPTRSHAEVLEEVCRRGIRGVFLEKPISLTLAEADRMIELVEQANVKVAVNVMRNYSPTYRRVRALIAQGTIGGLRTVMVHWKEGFSFGGSHLFDLLRFLIGAEARWVYGHVEANDDYFDPGGSGVVGYGNGTEVYVNLRPGHAAPREIDLVGDAGRIRIGDTLAPELYVTDPISPFHELVHRVFPGSVLARSAMTVAVEELVRAVRTGEEPSAGLRSGRAALEIAVAFHLSSQTDRVVALPVADRDLVVDDRWGRS